jgi:hypothetical protein
LRELQVEEKEGKLLSRDTVVRTWSEAYTRLRTQLLAVPDRCASAAANQPEAVVRRILRSEIVSTLETVSKKPI